MGAGIAEVCARADLSVVVVESSPEMAALGRERIARSLGRAQAKGRISSSDAVMSRIEVLHDLEALAACQYVIEAVAEEEPVKVSLFRELDRVVASPEAILASNTSSIPIMKLAAVTQRPTHVLGIHFFNPAPVMSLVEIIPSLFTAPEVVVQAKSLVENHLGKYAIASQDRSGFVVNALLIPYILSAIRMLESGFATARDIDEGMVRGCAHPQGPLALADLIGLDTTKAVAESMFEEFKEPLFAPPPLLARMVDAGLLGRKSGRGFHSYSAQRPGGQ